MIFYERTTFLSTNPPWWAGQLLTPLVVSLIVAVATSAIGYQIDKRSHLKRLRVDYSHQQMALFAENVNLQKSAYLEAAELLCDRINNFYRNCHRGWLSVDYAQATYGYYAYSFAYRIAILASICYQIEKDASYRRAVATKVPEGMLKYVAKLQIYTWTKVSLFDGLPYDDEQHMDHFYRDALAEVADNLGEIEERVAISTFRTLSPRENHAYRDVFDFIDCMSANELGRYRHDRLVAVHLVTLASLFALGERPCGASYTELRKIASKCEHGLVLQNLIPLVMESGVGNQVGYVHLLHVLNDEVASRS